MTRHDVLLGRVEALAKDVGRLRRGGGAYLVDRLAEGVDAVDVMLQPTAGELVAAGVDVEQALRVVDERRARLRRLLAEDCR